MCVCVCVCVCMCSVMSNFLLPTSLLCPWDFPGSNTGVGCHFLFHIGTAVKNLPAMQGTQVRSLGQKDTLEKEMAIHSSILASKIPRTEEPGGLHSMGSQRVGHD